MASKPRIMTDGRDMIWSLIPLLILCAVVAIASGNCSVGLKGDASDDRVPAFDVTTALATDAQTMDFPVRRPPTPEGWKPNSGSTQMVGDARSSNVGWVSANGSYVQLTQTNGTEEALVAHLGDETSLGDGQREAGGKTWVVYKNEDGKQFWITDLGDVRIAVLSKGSDADIETIAASTVQQEPLPTRPA